jgi:hypothetical protein
LPQPSRGWEIGASVLSLVVWVLIPKCPMCLAAHVALWTGLGLSFTGATYVRWSMFLVSGLLLLYVAIRLKVRTSARREHCDLKG